MATVYKRENSPYYQASIVVGGVRRRFSTEERDRRKAQKKADDIEAAENKQLEDSRGTKFSDAASRFFKVKKIKPKTEEGYRTSFTNVYSVLGDFSLASLTEKNIKHYVNERLKVTGSVSIRRDLAFLSSLYSTAKHWDDLVVNNPARSYDKKGLPEAKARTIWLQEANVQEILDKCTQPYQQLFVLLAVFTGMRSSEILNLRWVEVDLKAREIILGNLDENRTKGGTGRVIPLTDALRDALRDTQRVTQSDWVFANPKTRKPYTTLKTFWGRVRREAGLPNVRIHDLRHTYASWGLQSGIDEVSLMAIMGHRTRSMVKRYAHSSRESLRNSVKKMERVTLSVTQPTDLRTHRRKKDQ